MVSINVYVLLALLQVVFILAVALGIWVYRLHRAQSVLERAKVRIAELKQGGSTQSGELENALAQATQEAEQATDNTPWYEVRKTYLQHELARVNTPTDGEPPSIKELETALAALLPVGAADQTVAETPSPAAGTDEEEDNLFVLKEEEHPEVDDENLDFVQLAKRQEQVMSEFTSLLKDSLPDSDVRRQLSESFKKVLLVAREIEICATMAGEENVFLKQQVAQLVKSEHHGAEAEQAVDSGTTADTALAEQQVDDSQASTEETPPATVETAAEPEAAVGDTDAAGADQEQAGAEAVQAEAVPEEKETPPAGEPPVLTEEQAQDTPASDADTEAAWAEAFAEAQGDEQPGAEQADEDFGIPDLQLDDAAEDQPEGEESSRPAPPAPNSEEDEPKP